MGSTAGSDGRPLDLASHLRPGSSAGTIATSAGTAAQRRSTVITIGGGKGCGTEPREHCGPEQGIGAS
jgi:hypothetical protein